MANVADSSGTPDRHPFRMGHAAAATALVALVYLALGALGLTFAIAPGYSSPIFPAAGFAVAILLWSERRVWPGIWIGSWVLNLGVGWLQVGELGWHAGLAAAGIASGATLQALLSWWLVIRCVGTHWRTLESERSIVWVLALAGPAACVISATTGVTILLWNGVILPAEYLYAWINWWSGDTLGVLILLPISLCLLYRHEAPWSGRLTTLVVPMLLALGLVGGAFYAMALWERATQKLHIQAHGEALATLLSQRFAAHREALSALRRLIEVTPDMSYAQFEYFTQITLKDNPDIFALSFNPYVVAARRPAFERDMTRKTGKADFEITERNSEKRLVRAAERAEYVTVGYISPLAGNRPAVGFDISSEPVRHAAIEQAIRSGGITVTAPIRLVQENRDRVGVLLLDPARAHGLGFDAAINRETLGGFAVGVIKADEMVQIATHAATIPGLVFQVDDAQSATGKAVIYRSENVTSTADADYVWQQQIAIADRTWTLTVTPTPAYLRQQHHWVALVVGAAGLTLSALLQMLILITTGKTAIIQRTVREQTRELEIKSHDLEDRNAQMSALFDLSADGLITFDRQLGVIKYVNSAFTPMTGLVETQIVGLDEVAFSDRLARLCIPSASFCGVDVLRLRTAQESGYHREQIELSGPGKRVLEIGLKLSDANTVSQILYFRDVTHQTEVDRMKSEFLSTAAHELRTPMASVYGFAELLLLRERDEATRRELLGIILAQAKRMTQIIDDLLDVARIEARQGKDFVLEIVAVDALVADAVAAYKVPANREAPLVTPLALPLHINVDRNKMWQALTNLLSNAYKYSPAGGEVAIRFVTTADGARVGIEIRDHGIGMTPAQVARTGERFYRADASGKILGTGLGMSIVKEIVELHGGAIAIDSTIGAGTTITLWLPIARAH